MNITSATVRHYGEVIKNHPLLSRKEEVALFKILRKYRGGKEKQLTRDRLFNSNIALVMKYAYQFSRQSCVSFEDLIGAGNEGLGIALDKFDYTRGNKFSTYAVPWIRLYIFRSLKVMGRIVTIPPHIIEKSRRYNGFLCADPKTKISEKEIRKQMNVTEKVFCHVKAAQVKAISIDQPYGKNEDEQDTLANIIPDPKSLSVSGKFLMDEEKKQALMAALNELSDIQKEVLATRYMSNEKTNLNNIGKKLHISGERVRQIEFKALRRIRFKMRQRGYLKLD